MADRSVSSKALDITLWVIQVLLSVTFIWAGCVKLFQPVPQVAAMWPWAGEVPEAFLKLTGLIDLLAGIGLVFPQLLRIKPGLTAIIAIAVIVLMVCASIFHIVRGEASSIGFNIGMAVFAGFVFWGRSKKARRI